MSYYYQEEKVENNQKLKNEFPWLADRIHDGRSRIYCALGFAGLKLENAFGWFLSKERATISIAKQEVFSSEERKLPGVAYVAVGGMAGNIFARNRIAPARWLVTSLATIGTFGYCFPKTSRKFGAFTETRFPALRERREQLCLQTRQTIQNTESSVCRYTSLAQNHYQELVDRIYKR
ncbi:MICOS complex subunit Mic23/26/27 [Schizosaccharomyces osmophilus]|uniref:MICOS complex subunit n=1 Tax=Schizosaccharomyces osmophilus TaxID=2545709 RepID=A0AAF0AYG4_9SCHI|nr:MICOS complex subunit Mic23/26/27 [Schizosaccharomyces osmophilus]WBW74599.1 MICOS complex subunit Mic23/26/27 [Schizosaccharomyces osmophilus]